MNQRQELTSLIKQCGTILHTHKCRQCGASDTVDRNWKKRGRSGFVVHHCDYVKGEKTHSDFPKTMKGRISYYKYLIPIIKSRPNTKIKQWWAYLCNKCHYNFSKHFDKKRMGAKLWRKMSSLRRITK